jgi:hypothetical protein
MAPGAAGGMRLVTAPLLALAAATLLRRRRSGSRSRS